MSDVPGSYKFQTDFERIFVCTAAARIKRKLFHAIL